MLLMSGARVLEHADGTGPLPLLLLLLLLLLL